MEIFQQDFIDVLDKQLFEGLGMSMTDEEQARAEEKVCCLCIFLLFHINDRNIHPVSMALHDVLVFFV